jgi:hypothetical protein
VGSTSFPEDVLLFTSVLYQEKAPVEQATSILKDRFGETMLATNPMPFTYTSYYHEEMGLPLYRILLAFDKLVPRDSMPSIKTETNRIEKDFMIKGNRTINLDPGLLTMENICLATTKPYTHRIYLSKGIWAEVTLIYRGNSFHKLDWTYPDYASEEMIRIFNGLRETYRRRLRCRGA